VGTLIWIRAEAGNSVKRLAVLVYMYPLCFYAVVRLPGTQIFILFGAAAGPVNHHAIDFFPRAEAESYRQFGLRKIAGTATDDPRLRLPFEENADNGADRIAIRFYSLQVKSNTAGARLLIVAVQIGRTVVGGHQDVQVAVAVKICVGKAAADFWRFETTTNLAGNVAEYSAARIQKNLGRLRVSDVAADVADGFINMTVGDGEVQSAVEIDVEENAAKSESVPGGRADAGGNGYVVENSWRCGAIEADHFVVEIGDRRPSRRGLFLRY